MPYIISTRESLYLDIMRTLAALAVLVAHATLVFRVAWVVDLGRQAVIVFFVLSGYVISNVAATRETTPRAFLVARFARLWSVMVPAMALTILCDVIGRSFGFRPEVYNVSPIDYPLVRLGAVLSFLSESWISVQPFSNVSAWSLPLEFWYYMTFGAWLFMPVGRARVIAVTIALCMSGQKGILLLPIWVMGVVLQRSEPLRRFRPFMNMTLCVTGFVVFIWLLTSDLVRLSDTWMGQYLGQWIARQCAQARGFWYDWLLGLALTTHLLGAPAIVHSIPLERIAAPIRWCAGISFAAYLFHMPLLHVFAAFLPANQGLVGIGLTLAAIALLGPPVERGKYWWRRQLNRVGDVLQHRIWPGTASVTPEPSSANVDDPNGQPVLTPPTATHSEEQAVNRGEDSAPKSPGTVAVNTVPGPADR